MKSEMKVLLTKAIEDENDALLGNLSRVILTEMLSDDSQTPEKTGWQVADALLNNDASALMLALTGWTPESIIKKAEAMCNG